MGKALEIVTGRATNPAALAVLTADTGDSFTVRSAPMESIVYLEDVWAMSATAGIVRIRSPRLHDASQAIRIRTLAANARPLLGWAVQQRLYPQDNLTFEIQGGGAEVDMASFMVYYPDLPGVDARLATWEEISPRIVNVTGMEQNVTTGATAGDYGGSQALNADFDTFKRNVLYAILGYVCDTRVCSIGIKGPDTGNLRVGGPGEPAPDITRDWFVNLSRESGRPHIPIINAANIAGTSFDVASTATGAAVNCTLIMAELSGT